MAVVRGDSDVNDSLQPTELSLYLENHTPFVRLDGSELTVRGCSIGTSDRRKQRRKTSTHGVYGLGYARNTIGRGECNATERSEAKQGTLSLSRAQVETYQRAGGIESNH